MIPADDHILPLSETPLNKSLAALSTRLERISAPTREVWNPWTCPPAFLKTLAHAFSVDLWVDEWSETRKRRIIANAVEMHRQKGTLAGVLNYLQYVDAELVGYLVPPIKLYSGPSLTREEREVWLDSLPQVRTWRIRDPGHRGFATFSGSMLFTSFFDGAFLVPSTALQRLRRRARWVVNGVETETRVSDYGGYFRLHREGKASVAAFCNRVIASAFFVPSTAYNRLVTVRPASRLAWRFPVGPTLEPVTAEPERIAVPGTEDHGAFCGRIMGEGYLRPSTAAYRIYWRFAVYDQRRVNRRPSVSYIGASRFSFPAHTAHLQISKPGRRARWAAGEGIHIPGTRFWLPHDPKPIQNVRRALVAAKRVSDNVFIRFHPRPRLLAGEPFFADIDKYVIGKPV